MMPTFAFLLVVSFACSGCALLGAPIPRDPPPLHDLEEPLELGLESQDEAARAELDPGSFTGIRVGDARRSLDELAGEPEGLLVEEVVLNSPGEIAGVLAGDLLIEARGRVLRWPSEWRELELGTAPGAAIEILYDRAGVERRAELVPVARVRPAEREPVARLREEEHVGVVLRTATEVEARAAGLGPGGGAVIVGLSRGSPWRRAGLRFEDLVRAVDGTPVAHPEIVLDAIRRAGAGGRLELEIVRDGERSVVVARTSSREQEVRRARIPLLYSYENDRGLRTTSVLLGLVRVQTSPAAWHLRLLWLFEFGAGDADRLEEVGG